MTLLVSDNFRSGAIWIYPDAQHRFVFPLTLKYLDENRLVQERRPRLELPRCFVETTNEWFQRNLGQAAQGEQLLGELVPLPALLEEHGAAWYARLPNSGLRAAVTLKGDFGEEKFQLRVCRPPQFRVRVEGWGVLQSSSSADEGQWQIWRHGILELFLVLEAVTAPVVFAEPPQLTFDAHGFEPSAWERDEPTPAGQLLPGAAWRCRVKIDTRDWRQGDVHQLSVLLPLDPLPDEQFELSFSTVTLGDLQYSLTSPLQLEAVQFGERLTLPVDVTNTGQAPVFLHSPRVVDNNSPADWLTVCWAHTAEPEVELDPGSKLPVEIAVDLSILSEGDVPSGGLAATVTIQDELERNWDLRVVAPRVVSAPPFSHFLAVDFGNTNTYAAVWNPGVGFENDGEIVPLLGPKPENYPSVIYFQDVSDPDHPKFVVGPEAEARGLRCPGAVVRGLKRWIGTGGDEQPPVRVIRDEMENEATYDVPTLAGFFLQGVIRESEKRLRRRIGRVGLSFPVKFDDRHINVLRGIGASLSAARRRDDARAQRPLQTNLDLDEASAVTLEFALHPQVRREDIAARLSRGKNHVVVASLDFGGGSIDTTLVRMRLEGPAGFEIIRNEFLGFGGDAGFGGDNVTVAVMEVLCDRLSELLSQSSGGFRGIRYANPDAPIHAGSPVAPEVERENFRRLWSLAEQTKIYLCRAERIGRAQQDRRLRSRVTREHLERLKEEKRALVERFHATLTGVTADYAPGGKGAASLAAIFREEKALAYDSAGWDRLSKAISSEKLLMSLEDIYRHVVRRDLQGRAGYTVRQRVEQCVQQLSDFADNKDVPIDFLVMAGAGCHLPLVHDAVNGILGQKFPQLERRYDPQAAKSKVAFGLVRYLHMLAAPGRAMEVTPSTRYLRDAIGVVGFGSGVFRDVLPVCTPVDSKSWHSFGDLRLVNVWSDVKARLLHLHRGTPLGAAPADAPRPAQYRLHGTFDLSQPGQTTTGKDESGKPLLDKLPEDLPEDHEIHLRLAGAEDRLQIKIETRKTVYGYWTMRPAGPVKPSTP